MAAWHCDKLFVSLPHGDESGEMALSTVKIWADKGRTPPSLPGGETAVPDQLERVIASAEFRNGKRYPSFLRFIMEETLAGNGGQLTERVIGAAEAFNLANTVHFPAPVTTLTASNFGQIALAGGAPGPATSNDPRAVEISARIKFCGDCGQPLRSFA